ncbi:MAG TPA: chemotaxis protein CheW [Bacteroidales bacterium]|jgi:purine-binding chemotaxis protein CheW|nr:chemotaxis protein CheW [Bacteroidales bacterium]
METKNIDQKTSYISLKIGTESFAISVYKVLEIIQLENLTRVPNCSDFVPGVLNFRGSIVPVIDMHKRFNAETPLSDERMVIVVDIISKDKSVLMGLLVDQVTDVIEFDYKSIKSVPDLGIKYNPDFIEGFIEQDEKFIMVMNTDCVLSVQELSEISQTIDPSPSLA